MKVLRIYIDTSVIGGCLDAEFAPSSAALLDMAREGRATLLVSDLLLAELRKAPAAVMALLDSMPHSCLEFIVGSDEAKALRDAYLAEKVLGQASIKDAYHVALATVAGADVLVSWNFRHIVHVDKIRGFGWINMRMGYRLIEIRTPEEVA